MAPLRVLIIGGGVGGLALAFWLGRLGHSVTVVERFPELRAKGQQIDLRGQGVTVARRMGLLDKIKAARVPEQGLQLVDGSGRTRAFFGFSDTQGKGRQGFTSDYEIMRGTLCRILYDAAGQSDNVKFVFGTTVDGLEQDEHTDSPVTVRFSSGTSEQYDLVVGADGQGSRTRRQLLGLKRGERDPTVRPYGVYAGFFSVASSPSDKPLATMLMAPERRAAMTRVDNPRTTQAYLMVHGENPRAPELAAAIARRDVEAQRRAFADIFDGAGWETARLVRALRDRLPEADDFYATDVCNVQGRSWTKGRITLLGDAGYSAATLSGFGTSGALIGAYVLAGEIARHTAGPSAANGGGKGGVDVAGALKTYDAKLRPLVETAQNIPAWAFKFPMQKSSWTLSLTFWFFGIITLLRIDKLLQMLGSDDKAWDLPEYPELDNLKA
ncbi:hypothetical protein RB595_005998 [Gaeumannomyces hyphopodioides]